MTKYAKTQDRDFYANYIKIQTNILDLADELKDAYATYYNIKINKNMESKCRLDQLRKALCRLYYEIKPKLKGTGNNYIKLMIDEMDIAEKRCEQIPFEKIRDYKDYIIDWIESSGLSKINIEKDNIEDQAEKESYGED